MDNTVSLRGLALAAKMPQFFDVLKDPWDPKSNPQGIVNLGLAENTLMQEEMKAFINSEPRASSHALTYGDGFTGSNKLQKAFCHFMNRHFHPYQSLDPEHLLITSGASNAVECCAWALCDPGDHVLIGRPFWTTFKTMLGNRASVNVLDVSFGEIDPFSLEAVECFRQIHAQATQEGKPVKAILLCSPNNPLGRCYSPEVLRAYMMLCGELDLHLISDELYALSVWKNQELVGAAPFTSVLSLNSAALMDPRKVHAVWGLSKDFGATGLRMGCLVSQANSKFLAACESISLFNFPSSLADNAVAALLTDDAFTDRFIALNQQQLSDNYHHVANFFAGRGIPYHKPNAALFMWVGLGRVGKALELSDEEILEKLRREKVYITSGATYASEKPGWFRVVIAHPRCFIIQRARRYDKDGVRTVGIITKPDLINAGTEQRVARLAKNMDRTKLNLGFFLLKNPAPAELREGLSPAARKRAEQAFFSCEPWSSLGLDPSRVGIENLRVFLQDLLDSHIERELPKVRKELRELLERNSQELAGLGMERNTAGQIRIYLTQISADFHGLVRAGIDGDYGGRDSSFFDVSDKDFANRLRAVVHLENEKFANHMREYGQTRKVVCRKNDQSLESTSSETVELPLNEEGQILVTKEEMALWVKQVYHRTRGRELPGNYNHALLAELFHSQSMRWGKIARGHVDAVANLVSTFLQAAMKFVIKDTKVRQNVQNCVEKSVQGNIKHAIDELNMLLEDEARQPITYNHYYTDNIQKARGDQSKNQIQDSMYNAIRTEWNGKFHVNNSSDEIEKLVDSLQQRVVVNMTMQACSEAQNDLTAYYKVAMKTFVDNVCRQVIERHIIAKLPSVFEPVLVSGYETDELLRMAAESAQVSIRRDEARHFQEVLERSLEDLSV